jgi:hypothetical protein
MLELQTGILVVGCTPEALRYAVQNNGMVVYSNPEPPHFLDSNPETNKQWLEDCYNLSLSGHIPLADKARGMRLLDENSFRVILRRSFINIHFDKAVIFSDKNVEGLPTPTGKTSELYKVHDWINMRAGMSHPHERLESDSEFVNHILFYPTLRLDGHHPTKKDAVAVSFMEEKNLNNIKWSDSYARLKAISMMKEAGIKFPNHKVETSHREIIPLGTNIYPVMETVEFK